jgi:hypothetical protein
VAFPNLIGVEDIRTFRRLSQRFEEFTVKDFTPVEPTDGFFL